MKKPPSPPAHLSPRSKAFFRRLVGEYLLSTSQIELLRRACEAMDRCDQAIRVLEAEGVVVVDRHGQSKPHPAAGLERDSRLAVARLLRELNLEPSGGDTRPPLLGY